MPISYVIRNINLSGKSTSRCSSTRKSGGMLSACYPPMMVDTPCDNYHGTHCDQCQGCGAGYIFSKIRCLWIIEVFVPNTSGL